MNYDDLPDLDSVVQKLDSKNTSPAQVKSRPESLPSLLHSLRENREQRTVHHYEPNYSYPDEKSLEPASIEPLSLTATLGPPEFVAVDKNSESRLRNFDRRLNYRFLSIYNQENPGNILTKALAELEIITPGAHVYFFYSSNGPGGVAGVMEGFLTPLRMLSGYNETLGDDISKALGNRGNVSIIDTTPLESKNDPRDIPLNIREAFRYQLQHNNLDCRNYE